MKKYRLYIMLLLMLGFNFCTHSEIAFHWENGLVKEKHFLTKHDKIYKKVFYDSIGSKDKEMLYDKNEALIQSSIFDESGSKTEDLYFNSPNFDTIFVKNGLEVESFKIISLPNFFKKTYHPNGKIESTGFVHRGQRDSTFHYYDLKGRLERMEHFKADSLVHSKKF